MTDGVSSTEIPFQPEEHWSVPWLLADRIARSGDRPLAARKSPLSGDWQEVSARAFGEEVAHVAAGLIGMGLEAGATVGIMAHTSYDWFLLDMAIARAGLISVPIYETSSAEQVEWIVTDSDVRVVITESGTLAELVRGAVAGIGHTVRVLALDSDAITTIVQAGSGVSPSQVDQRTNALTVDDVYSIIYTSGTTGRPKGVELTHRNAVGIPYHGVRYLPGVLWGDNVRLLLFLPLAHVYARCLQLLSLAGEGVLGHTPDARTLLPDLQSFAPSYILAVPRVLEKIYNAADAKAGSGAKLKLFRWAAKVAIAYSRALDTPQGPSGSLRRAHAVADRLVFRKIRGLMGPNARFIISGGGPLGQRLGHFYRGLGLVILEGYGLTETIGPVSVNTDWLNKIGTVGPPVCGNEIRIGEDDEIQVRGLGVFSTYHNNPSATAEAFTADGWFCTGDIGALDDDGYLRITGRKKELIVTAGGKNVAPAQLEDRLRGHPLISQVLVIGDGEPFISALITLDKDMLPQWLRNHGLPAMDVVEASSHPQVLAALDRAVARTNRAVSRAESIRTFRVLATDFTEANGLLTPSLKVKRGPVMEAHADVIADIYGSTRKGPQE
ncbi:AMP-dependent synthetase/ligase [Actinomyces oris]|uniref:AMP-dependent synthetase/ligase n=1 Tax=Actinomyces oris TaxID=544580 RepID=A0AAW9KMC4_9ACTO|nr:AMP-dependent synthetase/ligase [Actinomyces oris]MEA1306171.1 AMP-dependent synthetase/ligase [Actinomyces oris]